MRYRFCLLLSLIITVAFSQDDGNNFRKPKITNAKVLAVEEDGPVTVQLGDLEVRDKDSWFYPWGFTLTVYAGTNYTVNGQTIIPAANFNGTLSVPVSVNDGQHESNKYNLQVHITPVNDPPVINGQANISTNEDQSITIHFSHLVINDPDDSEFTLGVSQGTGYSLNGQTVIPTPDFNGTLSIPVHVNDGDATSNIFNLQLPVIAINDVPKITGQAALETDENKPLLIQLSHLTITDADNTYPNGFTLSLTPSGNSTYSLSANQVIPAPNFEGELSVPVVVNDGVDNSEPFMLKIKVFPVNDAPVITGQKFLNIKEDQSLTIQFSDIMVTDADNSYPTGFTLNILPGTHYTSKNNIITPKAHFNGSLTVNITVNDGANDSNTFGLLIGVTAENDSPEIVKVETEALTYQTGRGPVFITQLLEVTDADNDSITQAEISFKPDTYRLGIDELIYEGNSAIKGVFDRSRGLLFLSGKATLAVYTKAIRSVKYNYLPGVDLPFESKTIIYKVSDGKITSEQVSRQINGTNVIVNLDIPTGFTPNGDFSNDTWSIKPLKRSEEEANAVVRIYNKSGQLLFEAEGFEKEWDGRLNGELLPADTYYYTIDLDLQYSRTLFKGLVTILR
jgi:gliding motility-associated-like protein